MNQPDQILKILHVEDTPTDAELVARELKRGGLNFTIHVVDNQKDFVTALDEFVPQLILSDHSLPGFSSLGALKIIQSRNLHIPFILITSNTSEETAVSVMKAGAWDYILKDRMQRLPLAVKQAHDKYRSAVEKQTVEQSLKATAEKLFFHLETSPLGFIEWHPDFSLKFASTRARQIFGWNLSDIVGNTVNALDLIYKDDREWVRKESESILQDQSRSKSNHLIHRSYRKDGSYFWGDWFNSLVRNEEGEITSLMSLVSDITDRKNMEQELIQGRLFLEKAGEAGNIGYWTSEPDEDGKLTWSKEVFNIFQVAENEFDGKNSSFFKFVHPDDVDKIKEMMRVAIQGNQIYNIDHRILLKNGKSRWVNERAQFVRNEKNEVTLVIGIVQDINDRKIIEEVLREYNDRYEILSRATKDVIWDWNMVTDQVLYNNAVTDMLGYNREDLKGNSSWWEERLHPDDRELAIQNMKAAFAKHLETWEFSYRFRKASGEYIYINDRSYVIYNKQGSPIRVIGAMQDVTEITEYRLSLEQKVAERTRELNEALQKEKELVDLRSRFVSIASHEFRTPLSSIALAAGFIRKFKKRMSPEEIDKKLDSIETQVKHMTALLGDVLTVGKSDAGKIEVNWIDVELQPMFAELANEVAYSTKHSHVIQLGWGCSLKTFKTDEGLIRNIVINLLTNAIKFSPAAETVDLFLTCSSSYLTIRVRDYGMGMPPDELPKIFEPFYRAKNTSAIAGSGLGLSIVKKATDLLGGTIDIKSELGKGSEFIITLPLK